MEIIICIVLRNTTLQIHSYNGESGDCVKSYYARVVEGVKEVTR